MKDAKAHRRANGVHYTPTKIFEEHIYPKIKDSLWDYCWIDLYCGEGNLLFPILGHIPEEKRNEFFAEHICMFDIDPHSIEKCIKRAVELGILEKLARERITCRDTLANFPKVKSKYQLFHVTNPPYLYLGYISKHPETKKHLQYFQGNNEGLQDLYQIALANDFRAGIGRMIYIIPSNFLFGDSASNKIRKVIYPQYNLKHAVVFEKKIFEETGTNVMIGFFEKKNSASNDVQEIEITKINSEIIKKKIVVSQKNGWRTGGLFAEYMEKLPKNKLKVSFYLLMKDVKKNTGNTLIVLIDSSSYSGSDYKKIEARVAGEFAEKIRQNTLWIRTVDTGSDDGKAGFYDIHESFSADGIVVGNDFTYRTSPIQVFFEPEMPKEKLQFAKIWANCLLNYLREKTDGEFMTTYKYSQSKYTRKYLGLKQAKALLKTCPICLEGAQIEKIKALLEENRYEEAFGIVIGQKETGCKIRIREQEIFEQTALNSF